MNEITKIIEDYKPNETIFSEDDNDVYTLKKALESLEPSDKIIFVMYCENGSLRKVGKQLGVSHTIIYKQIQRIKKQIYDYVKLNRNNDNCLLLDRLERVCNLD